MATNVVVVVLYSTAQEIVVFDVGVGEFAVDFLVCMELGGA